MLVIGIIGPKTVGKDSVARYIAKKTGGRHHSHSEILEDILALLHVPNTRANIVSLVVLRELFGPDVLIRALNRKLNNENAPVEVVTGIRFQNEFDNIRSFPENKIIFIDASVQHRYEWQKTRGDKSDDATMTYEKFLEQEKHVTETNIRALGEQADIKIENSGSEPELFAKIDQALNL